MGQKGSPGKVLIHFLYYIKSTITRSDNNLLMKNDVIWNCKKIIISAIKGSYQHISITDHTNWTNDEIHPINNPTNQMDVSMVDDKSNPFFFAPRSDLLTLRLSKCKDSPKLFSRIKKVEVTMAVEVTMTVEEKQEMMPRQWFSAEFDGLTLI